MTIGIQDRRRDACDISNMAMTLTSYALEARSMRAQCLYKVDRRISGLVVFRRSWCIQIYNNYLVFGRIVHSLNMKVLIGFALICFASAQFQNGRILEPPIPALCAQRIVHERTPDGKRN